MRFQDTEEIIFRGMLLPELRRRIEEDVRSDEVYPDTVSEIFRSSVSRVSEWTALPTADRDRVPDDIRLAIDQAYGSLDGLLAYQWYDRARLLRAIDAVFEAGGDA